MERGVLEPSRSLPPGMSAPFVHKPQGELLPGNRQGSCSHVGASVRILSKAVNPLRSGFARLLRLRGHGSASAPTALGAPRPVAGPRARQTRKPVSLRLSNGQPQLRLAERQSSALLNQDPPRRTR